MNRYLLDTHTFLWAAKKAEVFKLGKNAIEILSDMESELYISSVSIFEIMNKYRKGQMPEHLTVAENYMEAVNGLGAKELPLDWEQADLAGTMDWEHKDPFDRMLAAQARTEDMIFITCDKIFDNAPGVETLW